MQSRRILPALFFENPMNFYSNAGIIFAAGGSSTRFGCGNKLLCNLKNIPVFLHSIRTLGPLVPACNTALAVHADFLKEFQRRTALHMPGFPLQTVPGGATRTESVLRALEALPQDLEFVAVHDAARPLVTAELFRRCLEACARHGAAIAAHRINDTVKMETPEGALATPPVERDRLWGIETPQVFRFSDLLSALRRALADGRSFTDDAAAVEFYTGLRAVPVENKENNIKITRIADLRIAEAVI